MDLIESIRSNFNKGYFGRAMIIDGLPADYPAWTIKQHGWYGVAVQMDRRFFFSEHFASARIWTAIDALVNNQTMDLLFFTCSDVELRNEFAVICSQFVDTSIDGYSRKKLLADPAAWWENWKNLIGNSQADNEAYPLLGELTVVEQLLKNGENPKWSGIESATHDVELENRSYEVKSTIKRYGYEVDISSIYQMKKAGESLDLVFFRFEPSPLGRSLDDVVDSIVSLGFSKEMIETALEKRGLEKGRIVRSKHYKQLEMRVYAVDESFPVLTLDSFVGGQLPPNVTKINYTIDLSGISSKTSL